MKCSGYCTATDPPPDSLAGHAFARYAGLKRLTCPILSHPYARPRHDFPGTDDKSSQQLKRLLSQTGVKGGVNLDHFGGAKVDQLVKG